MYGLLKMTYIETIVSSQIMTFFMLWFCDKRLCILNNSRKIIRWLECNISSSVFKNSCISLLRTELSLHLYVCTPAPYCAVSTLPYQWCQALPALLPAQCWQGPPAPPPGSPPPPSPLRHRPSGSVAAPLSRRCTGPRRPRSYGRAAPSGRMTPRPPHPERRGRGVLSRGRTKGGGGRKRRGGAGAVRGTVTPFNGYATLWDIVGKK